MQLNSLGIGLFFPYFVPMEKSYGQHLPEIIDYAENLIQPEDTFLKDVRARAEKNQIPSIHVGKFDGRHLEVIARAVGATKIVEIGTLAGYSGVCLARALPREGKLWTFEFEPKHAECARETFRLSGFDSQIELVLGAAVEMLPLINAFGPFDLVFVDADKVNYPNYLEWAAVNLRVGGTLLADNTFAWNMITDTKFEDPADAIDVQALQKFNLIIAHHSRFRVTMLPTGEGLTMAVKTK